MSEPLNDDDPGACIDTPAGPVRNLTADEYAATYAEGEPHCIPDDVLNAVEQREA